MEKKQKDIIYLLLRDRFGFREFRPMQYQIVRHVLAGGGRIAVMGTGAGKSLCYMLPAALLPGITLVVSPLLSLIRDQMRRARAAGLRTVQLGPGLSRKSAASADLIFTSPERLFTGRAHRLLAQLSVSHLVIDEAHCVETWGSYFRPYLGLLAETVSLFGRERVSLFTASAAPDRVRHLSRKLGLSGAALFQGSLDRPEIAWHLLRSSLPIAVVVHLLRRRGGQVLLYCDTRRLTEQRATFLGQLGFRAAPYHAGLPEKIRVTIEERFQAGKIRVLCATSAFGMGVDISSIRTVLHMGPPRSLDSYYQESGRAGRDGRGALALMVLSYDGEKKRDDSEVWAFLRRRSADLPQQGLQEKDFLHLLEGIGEGRFEGSSLYAALLSGQVYRREPRERTAFVVPTGRIFPLLRRAFLNASAGERRNQKEVERFLTGSGCRREALLCVYGYSGYACAGCDSCGSDYSGQIDEAALFAERLGAIRRKILCFPLSHTYRIIEEASLAREDRVLAEHAFFRNC